MRLFSLEMIKLGFKHRKPVLLTASLSQARHFVGRHAGFRLPVQQPLSMGPWLVHMGNARKKALMPLGYFEG